MYKKRQLLGIPALLVLLSISLMSCGEPDPLSRQQGFGQSSLSPTDQILSLQAQLRSSRDSLEIATEILDTIDSRLWFQPDSILTRYALTLWKRGQSDDAITLLAMVDGRTPNRGLAGRRGTVLITIVMLFVVITGFLFVALRMFRKLVEERTEQSFNRVIAALAGMLIYFVFSVAGLSLPVLILNSLAAVKPVYAMVLNMLSMLLGATATLFVGTMLQSQGERTVQLGIILGVFTCIFFTDMLFKALFFAFDLTVLLPNTMFVLGVVLVFLFARDPNSAKQQTYSEEY